MIQIKKIGLLAVITATVIACSSSKDATYAPEAIAQFHELVQNDSLRINARWANPMGTQSMNAIANAGLLPPGSAVNRIDLIGTSSFLEIKGDSVKAHLPYYGERQMAGVYNSNDVGIEFNGVPKDFAMVFNEKKKVYEMFFNIKNNDEAFDVNAVLFPNRKIIMYINSSQRLTIQYQGVFSEITTESK